MSKSEESDFLFRAAYQGIQTNDAEYAIGWKDQGADDEGFCDHRYRLFGFTSNFRLRGNGCTFAFLEFQRQKNKGPQIHQCQIGIEQNLVFAPASYLGDGGERLCDKVMGHQQK